jgi:DNA-binding NarL/FixJ family response regulator
MEAVQKAAELDPDIVVLDIGMPILNSLEAAQQISRTSPTSSIVFLTQNTDSELMSAALNTGARGYVLKANAATELLPVITAALPDRSPV